MNHIFISYSRRDSDVVAAVVEKLRAEGLNIWQDISGKSSGIPFSTKWFAAIEEALHTSAGAVVFRSEHWERSVPCQKEHDLIRKLAIPCYIADAEQLTPEEKIEETVKQILLFANSNVYDEEKNELRTWLLSSVRASAARQNTGIPRYRKKKDSDAFLKRLEKCGELASEYAYETNMPDLYRDILSFLKKARRITRWDRIKRPLALGTALLMILGSVVVNVEYKKEKDRADALLAALQSLDQIHDQLSRDEFKALTMMTLDGSDYGEYSYLLFENYAEGLDTVFPSDFFPAGTPEAQAVTALEEQQETSGYRIETPELLGQITIHKDTPEGTAEETVTLMIASPVHTWAYRDGYLAAACGRQIYLYDVEHALDAVPLKGCYRPVQSVRFDEKGRICAATTAGDVFVWENPIQEVLCAPPSGIPETMETVVQNKDRTLQVRAGSDGTVTVSSLKHGSILYSCSLVREPVVGLYLEEENSRIFVRGYSGAFYNIDASWILQNPDLSDPVALRADYDESVKALSDHLVHDLGIAYDYLENGT